MATVTVKVAPGATVFGAVAVALTNLGRAPCACAVPLPIRRKAQATVAATPVHKRCIETNSFFSYKGPSAFIGRPGIERTRLGGLRPSVLPDAPCKALRTKVSRP